MRKKIIESFKQPLLKKNLFDLVIGSIFMFFPFINFISLGYIYEKLRGGIILEKTKLKWDENFKNYFIKGFSLTVLFLGYLFIPLIFLFLGIVFISILSGGKIVSLFLFRGVVLIIFSTFSFLISLYFLLFGICVYIEENSLKAGFSLQKILDRILLIPKEYTIIYIIIVGLLLFSIFALTLLFNWITGLLFSPFLFFYDLLVISNLLIKFYPRKEVKIQLPF
ncbi:MAG: DUF4013 domain-containing protein [Candidatus Omnitrophica bacterium]|nr:DUF4013 domain-containing protein [Candidatus Omnitrophota bacterium]